jgi:formyl-CoA transferase
MEIFDKIRILSLEQAMVLPHLTFRLAMDGMEVIRVENSDPTLCDPNRYIGENRLGEERMNSYYLCYNAGKKAITLNLREIEGRELLKNLIEKLDVDIFATNQLHKNYHKLGIDYETLRSAKKDIIWLGVTGFGPASNEAAYDPILQARGGLMELTGEPDGEPQVVGVPLGDLGASEHAYGLLMKALYVREVTGKGMRIDLSMFESTTSWLNTQIPMSANFGRKVTRRGNTHEFFAPVSVYPTKDGYVYIALGNDRQWASLTALEPFKSLAEAGLEKNDGRIKNVNQLNARISEITKNLSTSEIIQMFQEIRVPISKIQTIREVVDDPLVKGRLPKAKDGKTGVELTFPPPPFTTPYLESVSFRLSFPPRHGEHNDEIYMDRVNLSSKEMVSLRKKRII